MTEWYLNWLEVCGQEGGEHRSLPERVRAAVTSACARRGLAWRTRQCYGGWVARYAAFAGDERAVMRVETATQFLGAVVAEEDYAYSTQKQALNALAFFFKQVCGVEEPVFGVQLRKTAARMPVVLSQEETQRLFEAMERPPQGAGAEEAVDGAAVERGLVSADLRRSGSGLNRAMGWRRGFSLERGCVFLRWCGCG